VGGKGLSPWCVLQHAQASRAGSFCGVSPQVRQGQDLQQLAVQFCATHGLDAASVVKPLVAHIQNNLHDIMAAKREGATALLAANKSNSERSASTSPDKSDDPSSSEFAASSQRGGMDKNVADAHRRDLERERERRMKQLREVVIARRAGQSAPPIGRTLHNSQQQTKYRAWSESEDAPPGLKNNDIKMRAIRPATTIPGATATLRQRKSRPLSAGVRDP